MKKKYLFILLLAAFSANAQYSINFDDMSIGPVSPQSPFIELWPAAGVTDCNVVIDQANSQPNSMYVANNQTDDVIFLLGNQTSGTWTVKFNMYVFDGATGFWNIQDNEIAGLQWNGQFFAGATASGGSLGVITHDETSQTIAYPSDQWFEVKHEINLDAMTHTVYIDGNLYLDAVPYVGTGGVPANNLGSVNFYSIDTNNNYFIDDFQYVQGVLSTESFDAASFSVYPNPVKNILNIQTRDVVSSISIYNVLGKLVHQSSPKSISPSVDMANLKSGIYFVEVTIGNASKTVKVIK